MFDQRFFKRVEKELKNTAYIILCSDARNIVKIFNKEDLITGGGALPVFAFTKQTFNQPHVLKHLKEVGLYYNSYGEDVREVHDLIKPLLQRTSKISSVLKDI
jgi:hypothetical protein